MGGYFKQKASVMSSVLEKEEQCLRKLVDTCLTSTYFAQRYFNGTNSTSLAGALIATIKAVLSSDKIIEDVDSEIAKGTFDCYTKAIQYAYHTKITKLILKDSITELVNNKYPDSSSKILSIFSRKQYEILHVACAITEWILYKSGDSTQKLANSSCAFCGYFIDLIELTDNENRKSYIEKLSWLAKSDLENILHYIDRLEFKNPVKKPTAKKIESRLKINLLKFVADQNPDTVDISAAKNLICFITELLKDETINLYFADMPNDQIIFQRLYDCIVSRSITINVITCPDYSGSYVERDGKQIWSHDFKSVNNQEGVVTRRAYQYVISFSNIIKKYAVSVEINHFLPTFEFISANGFYSDQQKLSFEQCKETLIQSLLLIQNRYRSSGISAQTLLSDSVITDTNFIAAKKEMLNKIKTDFEPNASWQKYIDGLIKIRSCIYQNWYDINVNDREKLINLVHNQLAEYLVTGKAFTSQSNSILLASDSSIIFEIFSFGQNPVLFGKGAQTDDYIGD